MKKYPFEVGQRVRAVKQVTERGGDTVGDPKAKITRSGETVCIPLDWIHAESGEFGVVAGVDDTVPTVFFDRTGTATLVAKSEVEAIDIKAKTLLGGFLRWRDEIDQEQCLSDFDLALGWFSAKGCSHDEALRGANMVRDKYKGTP